MFLAAGIFRLNIYSSVNSFIFSAFEISLGILLIFLAYRTYQKEMEILSRNIYPMLFPQDQNTKL